MNLRDPKERTALAGEYVLGTFDENERRGFERQLEDDASLRAEVSRWHDRVLSLASRLDPVAPPAGLWSDLERDVLVDRARRRQQDQRSFFWKRVDVWQLIAGSAVALLVVFAGVLLLTWSSQRDSRLVALLQDGSGVPSWVIEARPRSGVRLRPVGQPAPMGLPGHRVETTAAEFWTRMPGAAEPVALGAVGLDETAEIPASRLPGLVEGQVFGITVNRAPSEPEDAWPSNPVVYSGKVFALPN